MMRPEQTGSKNGLKWPDLYGGMYLTIAVAGAQSIHNGIFNERPTDGSCLEEIF